MNSRMVRGQFRRIERGAVLVEFAIASFVFIFLAFGVIELMRSFLTAQIVGEASRIAARTAATTPGALTTLQDDMFYEGFTCIEFVNNTNGTGAHVLYVPDTDGNGIPNEDTDKDVADEDHDGNVSLDELFKVLPPMHSALRSVMIRDDITFEDRKFLRFPGSVYQDPNLPAGADLFVRCPVRDPADQTKYSMHRIVEIPLPNQFVQTNMIQPTVNYFYQFATLIPVDGGQAKDPIDTSGITAVSPYAKENFKMDQFRPINLDLGRPGGLHGVYRNLMIPISIATAVRKEVP